jgi:hypothetical protein
VVEGVAVEQPITRLAGEHDFAVGEDAVLCVRVASDARYYDGPAIRAAVVLLVVRALFGILRVTALLCARPFDLLSNQGGLEIVGTRAGRNPVCDATVARGEHHFACDCAV